MNGTRTVEFDVGYVEQRNRLTNAFRFILVIPHLIVVSVWGWVAQLLAIAQWFVIVFTGKRHQGMWEFQRGYLGYLARVTAYGDYLYDPYPPFSTDRGETPTSYEATYDESANRLTTGLRLLWAIPALFIALFLAIGLFFVLIGAWFVILFTGRQSQGMFDFILKVVRFHVRLNGYVLLMTDEYPQYGAPSALPAPTPHAPLPPPTPA